MTEDLAKRIVDSLFDLSSEQGGLIKSQCVQRVREIIAFDEKVRRDSPAVVTGLDVAGSNCNWQEELARAFVAQPNSLYNRFVGTVDPSGLTHGLLDPVEQTVSTNVVMVPWVNR